MDRCGKATYHLTLWVRTAGYPAVHTSLVYEARDNPPFPLMARKWYTMVRTQRVKSRPQTQRSETESRRKITATAWHTSCVSWWDCRWLAGHRCLFSWQNTAGRWCCYLLQLINGCWRLSHRRQIIRNHGVDFLHQWQVSTLLHTIINKKQQTENNKKTTAATAMMMMMMTTTATVTKS